MPFLEHLLSRIRQAGIRHVVLGTSYRAQTFAEHFGDGSAFGLELEYVVEDEPLGTGGGIRNASAALTGGPDDPVVIFNGDVLSGHDLVGQLAAHAASGADVTLHLVEVEDARAFGCVPTDAAGRVTGFIEKSEHPVTRQVNAGCYVFRRRIVDLVPEGRVVSVERETFPALVADGALVVGYVENAYATQNKLTTTQLRNKAGSFVKPETATFVAAAQSANWNAPNFAANLVDQQGANTWPIVSPTYILLPKDSKDAAKAAGVMKFFDWSFTNGAKLATDLEYIPLPASVQQAVRSAWQAEVKGPNGQAVALR